MDILMGFLVNWNWVNDCVVFGPFHVSRGCLMIDFFALR